MNRYAIAVAATRHIIIGNDVATVLHCTPMAVYASDEHEAAIKGYELAQERYSAQDGFNQLIVNVLLIEDR